MYREVTREFQVEVEPRYIPEESSPEEGEYVFSYHVRITNLGSAKAQLISRHWIITDGTGRVREVAGEGVVGEQPTIEPGESFEYSSFCPLPTPSGNMRGTYQMVGEDRQKFTIRIPLFFLRDMRNLH